MKMNRESMVSFSCLPLFSEGLCFIFPCCAIFSTECSGATALLQFCHIIFISLNYVSDVAKRLCAVPSDTLSCSAPTAFRRATNPTRGHRARQSCSQPEACLSHACTPAPAADQLSAAAATTTAVSSLPAATTASATATTVLCPLANSLRQLWWSSSHDNPQQPSGFGEQPFSSHPGLLCTWGATVQQPLPATGASVHPTQVLHKLTINRSVTYDVNLSTILIWELASSSLTGCERVVLTLPSLSFLN